MLVPPKMHWTIIINNISPKISQSIKFSFYTFVIMVTGILSAILTQKMCMLLLYRYKTPYTRNNYLQSMRTQTHANEGDYFSNPLGIPLFTYFFGLFYGFIMYQVIQHNKQQRQQKQIPVQEFVKISLMDVSIQILINLTIVLSSFTTVNLFNCCNLLSVVLFAVFCSKASHGFRVEKRQIFIAVTVTFGIIAFNAFGQKKQDTVNKPLDIWSFMLILVILIAEGYKPELMSQMRQKYAPPPSLCYYQVSKYIFIILLLLSTITTQLWQLITFIWSHDKLSLDLMLHGILDMVGFIFIYRIMVSHQQHVLPFVVTIRKLLTSVVNLILFKHQVQSFQFLALGVVGSAILLELYIKHRESKQKFKSISQTQDSPAISTI